MAADLTVAVLSGKGGTGKTMVSVNLALAASKAVYIDCDIEEPNGHLFLKPKNAVKRQVFVSIPKFDFDKCKGCRACVNSCKFNALAIIQNKPKLFEEVCHSCFLCEWICPEKAISERSKAIGRIEEGESGNVKVLSGYLNVGEVSAVPILKELLKHQNSGLTVMDCPPGSGCGVLECVKSADYCLLVAEPTTFSAHNLGMVAEIAHLFHKPVGVVLNKCTEDENPSETFCRQNNVDILCKIPYDREIGYLLSKGCVLSQEKKEFQPLFSELLIKIVGGAV